MQDTAPADTNITTTTHEASMPVPPWTNVAEQLAYLWPNCATDGFRPTFDVATGAIAKLPWPVPGDMIVEKEAGLDTCDAHMMWVPPEAGDTPVGVVVLSDYAWPACWPSGHPPTVGDDGTVDPLPQPLTSEMIAAATANGFDCEGGYRPVDRTGNEFIGEVTASTVTPAVELPATGTTPVTGGLALALVAVGAILVAGARRRRTAH